MRISLLMFRSGSRSTTDGDTDGEAESRAQRGRSTFVIFAGLVIAFIAAGAVIVASPSLRHEIVSRSPLDKWLTPPASPRLTKLSDRLPQEQPPRLPTEDPKSMAGVKAEPSFAFADSPVAAATAPVVKTPKPSVLTRAVRTPAPEVVAQPFAPTSIAIFACFTHANAKCGLIPVPRVVAASKRWAADASTYRRPWVVRVEEHLLQDQYWLCPPGVFNKEPHCWKLPQPTGFRPHMPDGVFAANSR